MLDRIAGLANIWAVLGLGVILRTNEGLISVTHEP